VVEEAVVVVVVELPRVGVELPRLPRRLPRLSRPRIL
jgi:hypothetical protein